MIFAIIVILAVLLIAFIHTLQGMFSATLSAILAIFSAVVALCYHETVVEKLLGGALADSAHAMVLVCMFAGIYLVLRTIIDKAVPGNVRLPPIMDKIGGGVMGFVAGIFAVGVIAVAAQEMSFYPSIWQYSRYPLSDRDSVTIRVPGSISGVERPLNGPMIKQRFDDGDVQKLILPVDDILVGLSSHLSSGSLSALTDATPLTSMHHDWLQEMFGQRLGIEPGARRVLVAIPGKPDNGWLQGYCEGTYVVTRALPMIDGELKVIRDAYGATRTLNKTLMPGGNQVMLVARLRFKDSAGERAGEGGGFIRLSCGSVRMVFPLPDGDSVDVYPIATLQHHDSDGNPLKSMIAVSQFPDDPLFVHRPNEAGKPSDAPDPHDSGVDFVFMVDKKLLGSGWNDVPQASEQTKPQKLDTSALKLPDKAFIEVKRLIRDDLKLVAVHPESDLIKGCDLADPDTGKTSLTVDPLRKDALLNDGLKDLNIGSIGKPEVVQPAAVTPVAPTPEPVAPVAPPPVETLALDVKDPPESPMLSRTFFTKIGLKSDSGTIPVTGGTVSVDKGTDGVVRITALSLDNVLPKQIRGVPGATSVSTDELFIPDTNATQMVLVKAAPRGGAADTTWDWRKQAHRLSLVSDKGVTSSAPCGVWVKFSAGEESKLTARYKPDAPVDFNSIKPAGELQTVWFAFIVPTGTKLTKLVLLPDTPVKDQPLDVPAPQQ